MDSVEFVKIEIWETYFWDGEPDNWGYELTIKINGQINVFETIEFELLGLYLVNEFCDEQIPKYAILSCLRKNRRKVFRMLKSWNSVKECVEHYNEFIRNNLKIMGGENK